MGLPRRLSSKESVCQCRRCRFNPWIGKNPWSRKWQPIPVFLPGKPHGQRSLAGYSTGSQRAGHNSIYLGVILVFQKCYKNSPETHAPYMLSLTFHITTGHLLELKTTGPFMVTHSRLYSNFSSVSTAILFSSQDPIQGTTGHLEECSFVLS